MQTVDPAFLSALSQDHLIDVRAEIYTAGSTTPALTIATGSTTDARIIKGSVTHDKKSDIRSRFDLTIVDPTEAIVPRTGSDLLTPFGNEMRLYRTIRGFPQILLGTFRISEVSIDDRDGGVSIDVTGFDRARSVSRNVFTTYYQLAVGVAYTDAIRSILLDRYPGIQFNASASDWRYLQNDPAVVTTSGNTPYLQEGEDGWNKSRSFAQTVGCDLYFDRSGVVTLVRDPSFTYTAATVLPPPVLTFVEGDNAIFLNLNRKLSDTTTYNRVLIHGEGRNLTAPLVSVPADDTDPASPTNIGSQYGIVSLIETNSLLYTQAQANDYAQLRLRQSVGAQELVTINNLVHPGLDIDDIVSINRSRIGLSNVLYAVDSITFPLLASDTMQLTLRERRALL